MKNMKMLEKRIVLLWMIKFNIYSILSFENNMFSQLEKIVFPRFLIASSIMFTYTKKLTHLLKLLLINHKWENYIYVTTYLMINYTIPPFLKMFEMQIISLDLVTLDFYERKIFIKLFQKIVKAISEISQFKRNHFSLPTPPKVLTESKLSNFFPRLAIWPCRIFLLFQTNGLLSFFPEAKPFNIVYFMNYIPASKLYNCTNKRARENKLPIEESLKFWDIEHLLVLYKCILKKKIKK